MRYDNAGLFAIAGKLSRSAAADPVALWAYLYSMGGRQLLLGREYFVNSGQALGTEESTPPLTQDELDHVMSCYQSLRVRRPELAEHVVLLEHVRGVEAGQTS